MEKRGIAVATFPTRPNQDSRQTRRDSVGAELEADYARFVVLGAGITSGAWSCHEETR